MKLQVLIVASLLSMPSLAGAVEFHHPEGPFVPRHDCTCRLDGEEVPVGQRRCLATLDGPRTAQCVLEQNVTSWRPDRDGCPQAAIPRPRG